MDTDSDLDSGYTTSENLMALGNKNLFPSAIGNSSTRKAPSSLSNDGFSTPKKKIGSSSTGKAPSSPSDVRFSTPRKKAFSLSQRCDEEALRTPPQRTPVSMSVQKRFNKVTLTPSTPTSFRSKKFPKPIIVSDTEDDDDFMDTDSGASTSSSIFSLRPPIYSSISSIDDSPTRKRQAPPSRETSPSPQSRKTFKPSAPLRPRDACAVASGSSAPSSQPTPRNTNSFFETLWSSGPKLKTHVIAHDSSVQKVFDNLHISWGVQYELSRGVTQGEWTWDLVRTKCEYFAGKSDASVLHKVRHIMKDLPPGKVYWDDSLGREFDREQKAILENCSRGLGLMGMWEGVENWFGGKIQQIASLVKVKNTYKLRLEPLEMRRSTRLARHLGSRRVLHIRIQKDLLQNEKAEIIRFLSQKFILNGRVFVAIPPKDDGVYAVEVNQDHERIPSAFFGDQYRCSFGDILNWHNPIELNSSQPISKFSARSSLALSNSIPVLLFECENIVFIPDIVSSDWKGSKPPADKILTDGCGFINEAGMLAITRALNLSSLPSAVQGRIAGSKGLWTVHPNDKSSVPKIYIRDSQRKIVYPHFDENGSVPKFYARDAQREVGYANLDAFGVYTQLERTHRILDLLRPSQSVSSAGHSALTTQSVLNLAHNGVPREVFEKLMKDALETLIAPLTEWERPHAMIALWDAINSLGRVTTVRMQRVAQGLSRVLGYSGHERGSTAFVSDSESDSETSVDDFAGDASVTNSGRDPSSGEPYSINEYALELIQSGFEPSTDGVLQEKIRWILKIAIESAIDKLRIPLPDGTAAEAFVIPDPLGVLAPNEIFYCSSTAMKDPESHILFHTITGEVLIGRYPIRLSSDIQKVTAVNIPQLARWPDVIIVSTKPILDPRKGLISLMSILSGGDVAFVIGLKALVESFSPTSLVLPPENFMKDNFEVRIEGVTDFIARIGREPTVEAAQNAFQQTFLTGLTESKVGLYSSFHDAAVEVYGYDSDITVRLAYMFNTILDGSKTGAIVKPAVYDRDQKESSKNRHLLESGSTGNNKKPYIHTYLTSYGNSLLDEHLGKYDRRVGTVSHGAEDPEPLYARPDPILLHPFRNAKALSEKLVTPDSGPQASSTFAQDLQTTRRAELALIMKHVDEAFTLWRSDRQKMARNKQVSTSALRSKKHLTRKERNRDAIVFYEQDIPGLHITGEVEKIKASYAYSLRPDFALNVAFSVICDIKASALNEGKVVCSRSLDQVKSISSSSRRLFEKQFNALP